MTPPVTSPLPARAWPRWPALAWLTLAVLGTHLALLAGGLPSWSTHTPASSAPSLPMGNAVPTRTIAPDAAPSRPAAIQTSQVRWIAPPTAQPTTPNQPGPPTASARPQPKPRPLPAPSAPALEETEVAAESIHKPMPQAAILAIERPSDASADPVPTTAEVSDKVQEPASEAPQTADTDTLLAAATAQREPTNAAANEANASPGPAQPPPSAQLSYSVEGQSKGLNYSASGSLDWRNEGSAYSARMEIRLFLLGRRVQTSQGQLGATGLQPTRFADKSRSERAAHFERPQNRIRFSNNAPDADLLPGAQDRLSVFLQLAGLLNARPEAYPAGHSIAIPVAGTSDSEIWRFQVQDLASLDLPAGSLLARHLVREPREPRDTRVDIWLAPSLGHLPVRIRLTQDNGDVVDQRLSALP